MGKRKSPSEWSCFHMLVRQNPQQHTNETQPIFPQQSGLTKHFAVSVFRRPLRLQTSYSAFAFKKTVRDSSGSGAHILCIYNIKIKVQWKKGSKHPQSIQWRHRVQLLQMPQKELWVGSDSEFQELQHSRIILLFKKPHYLLCWMSL